MCSVTQSCLTVCGLMDCSPPGSFIHGIFQAKIRSGLPFPTPEDLPDPGNEPATPAFAGGYFTTSATS